MKNIKIIFFLLFILFCSCSRKLTVAVENKSGVDASIFFYQTDDENIINGKTIEEKFKLGIIESFPKNSTKNYETELDGFLIGTETEKFINTSWIYRPGPSKKIHFIFELRYEDLVEMSEEEQSIF